jgi:hypothetical protein
MGGKFAGPHFETVDVKVAISEPTIDLVELGEGRGLVGLQLCDALSSMAFASAAVPS